MSNFLQIFYLKCQNLNKLQGKEKYKNWWKLGSFLLKANPPLQNVCPIINCQHSYILSMQHCVPIFAKGNSTKCYIRYHYLRGLKSNKPTKEVAYIYCKNSTNISSNYNLVKGT